MIKTRTISLIVLPLAAMLATGCRNTTSNIAGDWLEQEHALRSTPGITLHSGGAAAPINNPTVRYTTWHVERHHLILNGKRFRNDNIEPFCDTLYIEHLNSRILRVRRGDSTFTLYRDQHQTLPKQ